MSVRRQKKRWGWFKRLRRAAGSRVTGAFSLSRFVSYAPLLIILLSFYTVGLVRAEAFPSFVYLFLGLVLMASGVLGLRSTSLVVVTTIVLGEGALYLAGGLTLLEACAGAAGLILSATAIPLIARTRMLVLSAGHEKLSRQLLQARLGVGEQLAKGTTPNPAAAGSQPVAGAESLVRHVLLPAKKAMGCRTAIFYWYDKEADVLVPVETLSDIPEQVNNASISLKQGRLTGLKTRREPTSFRFNPHEPHFLPMYRHHVEVAGVMAVPVHHRGSLAGAFLFDRAGNEPFYLPENVIARRVGEMVEEALATERRLKSAVLLSQQLRMMDEAARQFSTARTFDQVYETAVRYAVSFSPFRKAVLAHRTSTADNEYELVGVNRKDLSPLLGKKFPLKGSLCELAYNARTALPPNYIFGPRMPQPFGLDGGLELEEDEQCVVLPLTIRDEAVGFLLLADNSKPVARDDLVSLFLFADYCAVSLVNAEANKALERMAISDALTGIPNNRAFRTRVDEAMLRTDRSTKPLSLLFIDIDHFKAINDTWGHPIGDVVLKEVAQTLQSSVRKVDMAARYGGEEFVVLLEETDSAGALIMAERLRQAVERLRFDEMNNKGITVSVGIATYPADAENLEDLLELADAALYRAKNGGRNQCQVA